MAEPDEVIPSDPIDSARKAAHSLDLLLQAIRRGELAATQLEMARLRGALQALSEVTGDAEKRNS